MTRTYVLASLVVIAACRSREEAAARADAAPLANELIDSGQKPLPEGMLGAAVGGSARANAEARRPAAARLRSARGVTSGEWVELQAAEPGDSPKRTTFAHFRGGSLFVAHDAMTLLHGAFVRALPEFDAFAPHLFDAAALVRLRNELDAFRKEWTAVTTAEAARARWGGISTVVRETATDDDWKIVQQTLAQTIDEIARNVRTLADAQEAMWVLSAT